MNNTSRETDGDMTAQPAMPADILLGGRSGRIAVAMSGGVDSGVTAGLLVEAGLEVFGITALLTRDRSRCCAPEDVEAAAAVARQLGIRHHVVELYNAFEARVVRPFISDYAAGRTPSPCFNCNRGIKFGALRDRARELGAELLATGHYARVATSPEGAPTLCRGVDRRKDQSYFLARLTPEQLARALFPLGNLTKPAVVAWAAARGLACHCAGESQDVCFVGDAGHGVWMDVRCLDAPPAGDVVDTAGRRLGRHRGIHHYTVGQRKGLGIAASSPRYVVRLDADRHQVVVGTYEEALSRRMMVDDLSWTAGVPPASPFDAQVQIRYRHTPAEAGVLLGPGSSAVVEFAQPQFAVAPGQSAVFYRGDQVLGAGWIRSAER
jgi:tRNA-specific 2-thiouridylase